MISGFEGPEKRIEFVVSGEYSLRNIAMDEWQTYLDNVGVKILSEMKGKEVTAYVLSESSLFVYDNVVVLKTCGTTRLLNFVDEMEEICRKYKKEIDNIIYSRKNFTFPDMQKEPHKKMESETEILNRKGGEMNILGKIEEDHWMVYVWSKERKPKEKQGFLEIKMHELDPKEMDKYYENPGKKEIIYERENIDGILGKGGIYDEHEFEVCGYSMNAIHMGKYYSTIHITPEMECSYVSYETNYPLEDRERVEVVRRVVEKFKPASYSVVYFSLEEGKEKEVIEKNRMCIQRTNYRITHENYVDEGHVCYPIYVERIERSVSALLKLNSFSEIEKLIFNEQDFCIKCPSIKVKA